MAGRWQGCESQGLARGRRSLGVWLCPLCFLSASWIHGVNSYTLHDGSTLAPDRPRDIGTRWARSEVSETLNQNKPCPLNLLLSVICPKMGGLTQSPRRGKGPCDIISPLSRTRRLLTPERSFPSHAEARTYMLRGAMIPGMDELVTLTWAAGAGRVCQ